MTDDALETFDCRVTVLNVVTPLDASKSESGVLEPDEARLEGAGDRADELIVHAGGRSVAGDRTVETGGPVETIFAYTESADIDHMVMGDHGGPDHDLLRHLLGAVTTAVTGEASVSVTVVR